MDNIKITGEWTFAFEDGRTEQHHNLIVQSGLVHLAALFIGQKPSTLPVYLSVGTGTTEAVSGDTKLQAEAYRKISTTKNQNSNMVILRFFLPEGEAVGDWQEWGIIVGGTEVLGTGTLFNRLVKPITKSSTGHLTIEVKITFAAG